MTNLMTRTAPLGDLHLHAFNPRQEHDPSDIAALAKSIAINGLMQNLSVIDCTEGLGVVAGGRRLRALQLLESGGVDIIGGQTLDFNAVPINVTDDEMLAHSWAGSEGATQLPLHPAEEIRAYSAMEDQGNTATTIAMAFGQTETHVKKRLKLAHLSDGALQALQDGSISLDVAKVLTVADSPAREYSLLQLATVSGYNANRLRHEIAQGKLPSDDRRVIYIGLDLYRENGGTLNEDLFTDQSMLHDIDMVDELFKQKLSIAADDLKSDQGWAQVVPIFENAYGLWNHTEGMTQLRRVPVDLPEADLERLDTLAEIGSEREYTDAESDELEAFEARQIGDFDDDECEKATVFIYVKNNGDFEVSDPYLRNEKTESQTGSGGAVAAKPSITNSGIEDLRKIQLLAVQTKMLGQPEMLLDLLAFQFENDASTWSASLNITPDIQNNVPSATDGVLIDARLSDQDGTDTSALDGDIGEAFNQFVAQGKKHRNAVLTRMFCRSMNAPFASQLNQAMMNRLNVSPRDVWTPTSANFFKACRSEYMDSIWRELANPDDDAGMEKFTNLKVGKKRDELEALFNDTSMQEALRLSRDQIATIDAWTPKEMQ